ncbi:hypothetical protein Bpfe_022982 [Biomphalaria pfeifferi]|uniref:Protein sleepless n=1 Tax=Biomphalaria pfeifferi TaxID=112525 RepID=A0AAD8F194_BIOPF|nr:hypothetical protein Bpfe_022982 [Biomphalaria pfeifferi]
MWFYVASDNSSLRILFSSLGSKLACPMFIESFDDIFIPSFILHIFFTVSAIKCYSCDNSHSSACGNAFKAYQFQASECNTGGNTDQYKCGKQEQPPDSNGWVGVIRACYKLGDVGGMNETNGCHNHYDYERNFTAIFCFCDTSYCNGAPSRQAPLSHWMPNVFLSITLIDLVGRWPHV